jgi:hypothetical protein
MSKRTGPFKTIYADTTIPGTAAVAMTAFTAQGNTLVLEVKTTTGGCGSLTFTAERSIDGGTTYGDVIDRDSVWSFAVTTVTTAGTYIIPIPLPMAIGDLIRLSYTAATASGKVQVRMLNYEDPSGSTDIDVGDIVADLDNVKIVYKNKPLNDPATGSAAISKTTAIAAAFELISITLHLSAAGTTSENFVVKKDSGDGTVYDTNMFTLDLSTDSVVDMILTPLKDDLQQFYASGDEIAITWPNTETRTYGLTITYRLA